MTFGIPLEVLPITTDGELKVGNHMKWISRRRIKEAVSENEHFPGIDLPARYDVLLGRGKPYQKVRKLFLLGHCKFFFLVSTFHTDLLFAILLKH